MVHKLCGQCEKLEDNRVQVWFVRSLHDGSWGYETNERGGYGAESLEEAMRWYLAVRDADGI